jgi:hypothetical protein
MNWEDVEGVGLPRFQHRNTGKVSGPGGHGLPPHYTLATPRKEKMLQNRSSTMCTEVVYSTHV